MERSCLQDGQKLAARLRNTYVEVNCWRKKRLQIPGDEECLCANALATVFELTAKTRETHSIAGILLGAFAKLQKASSHLTVCPNGKLDYH
jgi:hypothetical protein